MIIKNSYILKKNASELCRLSNNHIEIRLSLQLFRHANFEGVISLFDLEYDI